MEFGIAPVDPSLNDSWIEVQYTFMFLGAIYHMNIPEHQILWSVMVVKKFELLYIVGLSKIYPLAPLLHQNPGTRTHTARYNSEFCKLVFLTSVLTGVKDLYFYAVAEETSGKELSISQSINNK